MDTQQSFAYALANNSKTLVLLLSPFPCVACSPVSLYVGLIEAFRHIIKGCGNVSQRSRLDALCPANAKKKLKQSS